jgi:hypothetical protein
VRSVKDEVFSRLILFSVYSLRYAFTQYKAHYHTERPHQRKRAVRRAREFVTLLQRRGVRWPANREPLASGSS